ncbi:MAG: TolC family protein [candidate division Zixibacteria bacterium]|nr:TolC family protein [candidate division Zixibacteria bacterium]
MSRIYILGSSSLSRQLIAAVCIALCVHAPDAKARDLTLDEAIDIALGRTARGEMIKGNLEVAEQNYSAKRINFYLPAISINGSVPSYSSNKSYDEFFGQKGLVPRRNVDFNSFIELKQSLLTGGDLTVRANLLNQAERYPDFRAPFSLDSVVFDDTRRGFFDFSFSQPLLKPSSAKNELHNRRDDLEIAKVNRYEAEAALKKEVVEAYMGTLKTTLQSELYGNKLNAATLKTAIDSAKLIDGVVSEETYLTSTSTRLDAELQQFEIQTTAEQTKRDLAILLDIDVAEAINATEPVITNHFDPATKERLINGWESSVSIHKAEHEFFKAKRAADFSAAGHGLTGDLGLNYSFGRGKVETRRVDGVFNNDIKTSSYGISLNFKLPVFDGGSGSAAVKASRFQADQARLEYQRAQKTARAAIINLVNQIDVSYRRLEIFRKQIDLAQNRLSIAKGRYEDGQISEITYLGSKIFHLEARDKYLDELKTYLINRIDLESKFSS